MVIDLMSDKLEVPTSLLSIEHDLLDVLGEKYEQVKVSGDMADAKELLAWMAYFLMYEIRNNKGLTATEDEAHEFIILYHHWLVQQAGYKLFGKLTMRKQAEGVNKQLWDELFDGRQKLAATRFRQRVQEVDQMLPGVVDEIKRGNFDQIQNYVNLVKLDMDNVGYKAPGRYEILGGVGGDILTEADKETAAKAMREVQDYEKKLEAEKAAQLESGDEIMDAEFYDEVWGADPDQEEEIDIHKIVADAATTVKQALDETVAEIHERLAEDEEE